MSAGEKEMAVVKSGRDRKGASLRCARKSCGIIVARLDETEYMKFAYMQPNEVHCLACRARCAVTEIYGRFVRTVVCNAKCMGAVSQVCDCSCGGVNHAGGMAA
jgi:hypothetical protein